MKLNEIDRKYGIIVEGSRSHRVVEYDDETLSENEWEEIEVEFSYKKNRKIVKGILPLSHFISLYKDAKRLIKKGKNYTHASEGEIALEKSKENFDVLKYIEGILEQEREHTGPMYG